MSVYNVSEELLGRFDVVFFLARYTTCGTRCSPKTGCQRFATGMFVESAILDDFSPYRGGMGKGYPGGQMVIKFYPGTGYGNNAMNWWARPPSIASTTWWKPPGSPTWKDGCWPAPSASGAELLRLCARRERQRRCGHRITPPFSVVIELQTRHTATAEAM